MIIIMLIISESPVADDNYNDDNALVLPGLKSGTRDLIYGITSIRDVLSWNLSYCSALVLLGPKRAT
jgi:hypothetical protein